MKRIQPIAACVAWALSSAIISGGAADAGVLASSTFTSGLEGWISNTPPQVIQQSPGGNPGGYMLFTDATADGTVVLAPSAFLGNYIAIGASSISFDVNIIAETRVEAVSPYQFSLSGPGGSATWKGATPDLSPGWVSLNAAISDASPPSGWTVTGGTWAGLLANVTQFEIPIELVTNDQSQPWVDQEGIDNVVLSGASGATPEPSTWAMILLGAAGLGFAGHCRAKKSPSLRVTA